MSTQVKPQLCLAFNVLHTNLAAYKYTKNLAVFLARKYSTSSCRWRGVKSRLTHVTLCVTLTVMHLAATRKKKKEMHTAGTVR